MTAREIAAIRNWAERTPQIETCWVFGSRAGSTFKGRGPCPASDIDIAVAPSTWRDPLGAEVFMANYDDWHAELEALLPYKVDLSTPSTPGGYTARGIASAGRIVFDRLGRAVVPLAFDHIEGPLWPRP